VSTAPFLDRLAGALAEPGPWTVNALAHRFACDPRVVRVWLLHARDCGLVEVDETFVRWRLADPVAAAGNATLTRASA
jgi:hypothetical protein